MKTVKQPVYLSELVILDDNFITIKYDKPRPNAWFRFWYRVLLSWQWRDLTTACSRPGTAADAES